MVGHNPGTNRYVVDPRSLQVKRSKLFFFANSVLNCRKESRHKLKSGLFNSLNSFVYGRRIDVFERQIEVNGQRGQITMK